MRSGLIESGNGNPADVGPMYPLVGYEISMLVVCLILWVLYTVWQFRRESRQYTEEATYLSEEDRLVNILRKQRKDQERS